MKKTLYKIIAAIASVTLIISGIFYFNVPKVYATTCDAGNVAGSTCVVILTSGAGSGNQTWSVPADFQSTGDTVACIGSGGSGTVQGASTSAGGGGGAYASSTSVTLTGSITYSIGASATSSSNTLSADA